MKFGKDLQRSIYAPWKDKYLDYDKLKELLRENAEDGAAPWTEKDETAFSEELFNVQLEKVNAFYAEVHEALRDRMTECETQLERFAQQSGVKEGEEASSSFGSQALLQDVLAKLDGISKEVNELEKFCRLNFTGAIKAAKKHDRRRGANYRIRPILQLRLASLPFNSEDYSPLLYRLSTLYMFVRQRLDDSNKRASSAAELEADRDHYSSYKFFVHPDNLLEVKTFILRHLPVLIYSSSNTKVAKGLHEDPTVTSLYFDSPDFYLYNKKLSKGSGASSLRIRWFGQLADKPELVIEEKSINEDETSEEIRLPIKRKYIEPFMKGEYKMEKTVQKLRDRKGEDDEEANNLNRNAENILNFIRENDLQPTLRANYTRTAFQIPGESRIRVSIDTNLVVIREDSLDSEKPCRSPGSWHRHDIDDARLAFPFDAIPKGEISHFPYHVLEIKIREGPRKKPIPWVEELMSSHLVQEAPRFSKFVHGVASLFEDYVNTLPFWMSQLETDIRKNPDDAFREEQEKKAKKAEDEFAVGSFLASSMPKSSFRHGGSGSPARRKDSTAAVHSTGPRAPVMTQPRVPEASVAEERDSDADDSPPVDGEMGESRGLRAFLPTLSTSKYARAQRLRAQLPPGVQKPVSWIKDAGPVRVEPKVWLANQRTFVKWEHISVLLATLALTLFNAAGRDNAVARWLGVVYTLIAAFAGIWGWWAYIRRSRMIEERSGRDFDLIFGPVVVCIALAVALSLNFGFQYSQRNKAHYNGTLSGYGASQEL